MGLNVNSTRLAAISDNIANSATYGYKRTEVDFSSMVVNQRPSIYTAGGVRSSVYKAVSDQGSLISTGRATDIAVNGAGLIPVTTSQGINAPAAEREFLMVSTGGFSPDAEGFLRTTSGLYLLGWPVDANGNALTSGRTSQTGLQPVSISDGIFAAEPTSQMNLGVNLPADRSQIATGESIDLPVEYFDQLGLPQTLTIAYTPGADGEWSATITDNATGDLVGGIDLRFGPDGLLETINANNNATYDPVSGNLAFATSAGPISAFIGRSGENGGLTQLGATFSPFDVQSNGSPVGELQSVDITPDGFVQAIYDTGVRRTLFQIPVASVTNPDGLTAVDNQAFARSADSGDIYLWNAGDGPTGEIAGFTLMESTTDIAAELTALIETQRAYSSNAKIIQTVDEMLQETTNLKR